MNDPAAYETFQHRVCADCAETKGCEDFPRSGLAGGKVYRRSVCKSCYSWRAAASRRRQRGIPADMPYEYCRYVSVGRKAARWCQEHAPL